MIKGAGVVLYKSQHESKKILVLLKPDGEFDIPKGHSDPCDVNEFATAQRECFEETGIFLKINNLLTNEVHKSDKLFVFCATTMQEPELKQNPETGELEHIDYYWIDPQVAQKILPKYLANAVEWSTQF